MERDRPPLFGFLNCCKPKGMTSRDVVNVIQRRVRPTKVGHAGTLDPLAEGVLVVGVGPAVRLVPYLQQTSKRYVATFRFGQSSPTGDLEGDLHIEPNAHQPTLEEVVAAIERMTGFVEQTPPAYSAVWVDGQRAYRRIRAGEEFEMPKRTVHINEINLLDYEYPNLQLEITCGSGTYIRSIGIDLAASLNTTAVMSYLNRTAVGPFSGDASLSIDQLREDALGCLIEPAMQGVMHLPSLEVNALDSERLGNGLCIDSDYQSETEEITAIAPDGNLRAILKRKRGRWCPHRVFPTMS